MMPMAGHCPAICICASRRLLVAHDLFRKPVPTFRDHARMSETRPHGAFFGRRKGHPLRARQAELFETLLPRLAVDLNTPAGALASLFPVAVDDVQVEIGFGGAEHLLMRAKAN